MMSLRVRSLIATLFLIEVVSASVGAQEAATVSDAVTPVARDANWMIRHESMNARVKQGNVDLVFIGDSITQGWENRGKDVWQKYYGDRNAVNLWISGDRTQHVMWRLDHGNLDGISPKVAVIMIGTNNSGDNSSVEIAEGITRIAEQIREKTPTTKILLLGTFPRGADPSDERRQVNQKSNEIVKQLADGEHIFYLDISDQFLGDGGVLSKDIMPDLLHLSEKGYMIWAESIEPKLAELMQD